MLYYLASGVCDPTRPIKLPDGVSVIEAFKMVLVNFMRGISTAKGIKFIDKYLAKTSNNRSNI